VLVHVDCYRLKRAEEALDLDLPALAAQARLTVIEWPERAGPFAPAPDLHLRLEHTARPDRRAVERVR
jgi:tRNA threonylcarbamoyladenosine biosynthesis protein TsaE